MKVCPGARVLNNVDEDFGVVILPDGADHLEDVVCDKGGKLLNCEYETRARVDPGHRVMAVDDQTLPRSSKPLGFCDCDDIYRVGVPAGST